MSIIAKQKQVKKSKHLYSNRTLIEINQLSWRNLSKILGFILLVLFYFVCEEPSEEEKRIIINNDESTLSLRIHHTNEEVNIDSLQVLTGRAISDKTDIVILTLVAEVVPPTHDGITLQATDIHIKGNKVYVSYNVSGETFLGGIDVFEIQDISLPELVSNAIFTDTDVNGLTEKGGFLYLASATEQTNFSSPAILERIELSGGLLTINSTILDLPSYAATDVAVAKNWIYVTSGALGGYVTIIDKNTFTKHDSVEIEDARGVDTDDNDVGIVAGTPARLLTFDRELATLKNDYILTGANIPFSKSTIELNKKKAILALGDGGTQIVCLETGTVIDSVPQPVISDLTPSVTVTNAATADKRLLFMANGEAGVYVGIAETKFDSKDCEVDNLKLLGNIRFGDFQSVNHVAYKNDVLFIAGGLGGLKILTVKVDD